MPSWRSPFQHVLDGFPPSEADLPPVLTEDERWMLVAIEEARRGVGKTAPNPPVGCVLTHEGRAVGRGYHRAAGQPHAEVEAMRDADEGLIGALRRTLLWSLATTRVGRRPARRN